jgi:hypothetical protein
MHEFLEMVLDSYLLVGRDSLVVICCWLLFVIVISIVISIKHHGRNACAPTIYVDLSRGAMLAPLDALYQF